jgi:hypothetical protein
VKTILSKVGELKIWKSPAGEVDMPTTRVRLRVVEEARAGHSYLPVECRRACVQRFQMTIFLAARPDYEGCK